MRNAAARRALALAVTFSLAACAALPPPDAHASKRDFRPDLFFAGPTRSSGAFETPSGAVTSRFNGATKGHRLSDGSVVFDQTIAFDDGTRIDRSWHLWRLDARRYRATATDVVGEAEGDAEGSRLHLRYTVATPSDNPLGTVEFEQFMTLQDDGSMINRSIIRKFGITLRTISERFTRTGRR